ncbi:MAG: Hsp33 family molecular chaperone HslO [Alphaproteobacteria bacterium]|nr:Hsp33 family molecular chaperone HslO [Alphaproteobacteria bacterium]
MSAELIHQVGVGDIIRPFQLETSSLRGRIVRLDGVINEILEKHDYPDIVSHLVGETITLTALLSSMLKYEGIFTLQTQGDGPISMMVSDITSSGGLRGCAAFKEDRVEDARKQLAAFSKEERGEGSDNHLAQLLGKGHIAFTVDQGTNTERYQGIVELKGSSLVDCVQHYFSQSEQIDTGIKLAVGKRDGKWRASGIMLQKIPEEGGDKGVAAPKSNMDEDDWRRAMILMQSCTDDELLDTDLSGYDILIRLFHEEGIRVFDPQPVAKKCRCSMEKIENVLAMMSEDDRDEITVDGKISMVCEFCSHTFTMDPKDVAKRVAEIQASS